ncbi:hypothetical protein [Hanstruepera marina]|uniref:hypothetical protein n=1 Tax=Hanstruepera marina TaxID=2873265 RepID=UPI001CA73B9A|nr:hypothetical protein [Hanstruepera marina]
MFKKLALLSVLSLLTFSCKKEIQSKPNFVKLEYKSSKEEFLKSIEFCDSAIIYMKYESKKKFLSSSSINKLAMNLYFKNTKNLDEKSLTNHFNELKKKVETEILNHKEYDVFYVKFYKGQSEYSEREEIFD